MSQDKPAIQRRQPSASFPGEFCQPSIRHLAVTAHILMPHIFVAETSIPELMALHPSQLR